MSYQSRPEIIQAFQLTKVNYFDRSRWPAWFDDMWRNRSIYPTGKYDDSFISIKTPWGDLDANLDDWVIKNSSSALSLCKDKDFQKHYFITLVTPAVNPDVYRSTQTVNISDGVITNPASGLPFHTEDRSEKTKASFSEESFSDKITNTTVDASPVLDEVVWLNIFYAATTKPDTLKTHAVDWADAGLKEFLTRFR